MAYLSTCACAILNSSSHAVQRIWKKKMHNLFTLFIVLAVLIHRTSGQLSPARTSVRMPCGTNSLEQCSFMDGFSFFNNKRWERSSGYANGPPFDSWWAGKNVFINGKYSTLGLAVTKQFSAESGLSYASGEVKSNGRYGYGCYEAKMRPIAKPG